MEIDSDFGATVDVGSIPFIKCAVLNDLTSLVLLPKMVADQIKKSSGISQPKWPMGIYTFFTQEGISVGIYGQNAKGQFVNGVSTLELTDNKVPSLGEAIWEMWKALRGDEGPIEANFNKLLARTQNSHG